MKDDTNEKIVNSLGEIKEELALLNKLIGKIAFNVEFLGKKAPSLGEDPLVEQTRRIAEFLLHGNRDGMYTFNTDEDEVNALQREKLELELKELRKQLKASSKKNNPQYLSQHSAVLIQNQLIEFTTDSLENRLLKVILRNIKSMKKEWSWDEIVEQWGESTENIDNKTVYRAGKRVNEKIAVKTEIKEFLVVKTKTIQVNPSIVT